MINKSITLTYSKAIVYWIYISPVSYKSAFGVKQISKSALQVPKGNVPTTFTSVAAKSALTPGWCVMVLQTVLMALMKA